MRNLLALAIMAGLLVVAACDTEDTTAPTVSIVSPVGGDTLAKGDIVIKAVATDNKGVSEVEFSIDGALSGTINMAGAGDTFKFTWSDTAAQVVGHSYDLVAKAYDAADNTTTSVTVTIIIAGGGSGTGPTYHSGTIAGDETWYPSGNPHIITSNLYVQDATNSPTLTIMPGCIIEFQGDYEIYCGINYPGTIVANGKPDADSGIVFTTAATPKVAGSWGSVGVYYRATSATSFDYCTFEYAGSVANHATFFVENASAKLQHSTITQSASGGAKTNGTGRFTAFTGNTISSCGAHAVETYPEYVKMLGSGNTYTGNTYNDVLLHAGTVATTGTWLNQGVPYLVAGDLYVQDADSSPVLTIDPGTTVKMQAGYKIYVGINQPGGLIADGTSDTITFTSAMASRQPGDWGSLGFYYRAMDASCQLKNCRIEYGGSNNGNVIIENALPTVTGCDIGHSSTYGIYLNGSEYPSAAQLRTDNNIHDNAIGDIREP